MSGAKSGSDSENSKKSGSDDDQKSDDSNRSSTPSVEESPEPEVEITASEQRDQSSNSGSTVYAQTDENDRKHLVGSGDVSPIKKDRKRRKIKGKSDNREGNNSSTSGSPEALKKPKKFKNTLEITSEKHGDNSEKSNDEANEQMDEEYESSIQSSNESMPEYPPGLPKSKEPVESECYDSPKSIVPSVPIIQHDLNIQQKIENIFGGSGKPKTPSNANNSEFIIPRRTVPLEYLNRNRNRAPVTPTQNRFQVLANERLAVQANAPAGPSTSGTGVSKPPISKPKVSSAPAKAIKNKKPPPVVISGTFTNQKALINTLKTNIKKGFNIKNTKNNTVIHIEEETEYDTYVGSLIHEEIAFHTYAKGTEKTHAFILRGLDAEDITEDEKVTDRNVVVQGGRSISDTIKQSSSPYSRAGCLGRGRGVSTKNKENVPRSSVTPIVPKNPKSIVQVLSETVIDPYGNERTTKTVNNTVRHLDTNVIISPSTNKEKCNTTEQQEENFISEYEKLNNSVLLNVVRKEVGLPEIPTSNEQIPSTKVLRSDTEDRCNAITECSDKEDRYSAIVKESVSQNIEFKEVSHFKNPTENEVRHLAERSRKRRKKKKKPVDGYASDTSSASCAPDTRKPKKTAKIPKTTPKISKTVPDMITGDVKEVPENPNAVPPPNNGQNDKNEGNLQEKGIPGKPTPVTEEPFVIPRKIISFKSIKIKETTEQVQIPLRNKFQDAEATPSTSTQQTATQEVMDTANGETQNQQPTNICKRKL
ncbi:unnamed protein product [Brassicogethes aeneus]|uniref:Uncharacterized protein n=1 Tax=Brassicogethes aeneus TaxID=1431903 RepID=A0A9P0FMD5_BRAAE|nr:unnamed protein product [Brassicogethes aeneus]